ncbi:MAG: hypothetical protein ACK4Z8_02955 [Novosphingobium sp.]
MEFEIEETINPVPWQSEWRSKSVVPGRLVDKDDMTVRAMEIPESDGA